MNAREHVDPLTGEKIVTLQGIASRLSGNLYRLLIGRVPDDKPEEEARQRYYTAHERHAVVRDVMDLFAFADWAALEPGLAADAERLRLSARRMYDERMARVAAEETAETSKVAVMVPGQGDLFGDAA
jgi:hypothetical protein